MLATLTKIGRAGLAKAIMERTLHVAWGSGSPDWDAPDAALPGLVDAVSLEAEVGRRLVTLKSFVEPDDQGGIVVPVSVGNSGQVVETRYSQSATPTPWLYIRVNYNFEDAANVVIREIGLVMDTVPRADLPPGQTYLKPDDVADPGLLLGVQILSPAIQRSAQVRQSIEFVLPI